MREIFRLIGLFMPHWRWMVGGILVSLITFLADVGLLALSGWFLASMALSGLSGSPFNYFTPAAAIRAFALFRTGGRYLERLVTHEAAFRLIARLRVWFFAGLEPLAPARLQEYRAGDLLSRIGADIDTLDHFYVRLMTPVVTAVLGVAACVIFLSRYNMAVALVTLIFLLLAGIGVPLVVGRLGARTGEGMVEASSHLRAQVIDALQGMEELKVFGESDGYTESLEETGSEWLRCQRRMSRLNGFSEGAVGLCANLALWFSLFLLISLVGDGALQEADLAMLALFTLAAFEGVAPLPFAFQMLGHTLAAARRVFFVVDAEPKIQEPSRPSPAPGSSLIEMRDVSFRYGSSCPWALRGVTLKIYPGGKLGVVGASGSGKSTLIYLLLRFWDYTHGEIRLDGRPLESYRSEDVRRHVAVVPQDTHIFNTTIRENILLGNLGAEEGQVVQAAKAAGIHDFVLSQPDGYDTFVGEGGVKLSGGQARRVAIARALLKEALLFILDEPCEGLDPQTEQKVMEGIFKKCEGRAVLLITHRLAGLEKMDEVLILDHGSVVERGSHADLMAKSSLYRRYHDLSRCDSRVSATMSG
jgi:ATP-binding cassette subfamily C protein CydC